VTDSPRVLFNLSPAGPARGSPSRNFPAGRSRPTGRKVESSQKAQEAQEALGGPEGPKELGTPNRPGGTRSRLV